MTYARYLEGIWGYLGDAWRVLGGYLGVLGEYLEGTWGYLGILGGRSRPESRNEL